MISRLVMCAAMLSLTVLVFVIVEQRIHGEAREVRVAYAEQLLADPRDKAARIAATNGRMLLDEMPLDAVSMRIAGLAALREGQYGPGLRLMREARARSRRDTATDIWWFQYAARQHDVPMLLASMDVLARTHPRHDGMLFPTVAQQLSRTDVPRLVSLLNLSPDWRGDFLVAFGQAGDPDVVWATFMGLRRGPSPPSSGEIEAYIGSLPDDVAPVEARQHWLLLNGLPRSEVSTVYDPGFAGLPGGRPFNWTIASGTASSVEIAANDRSGLDVRYVDGGRPETLAAQLLVMAAGRYRMTSHVRLLDGNESGHLLQWHLRCIGQDEAGVRLDLGRGQARSVAVADFAIDPSCPRQLLSLVGIPGDRGMALHLQIADVRIAAFGRQQ
jgi:hypothetical protein